MSKTLPQLTSVGSVSLTDEVLVNVGGDPRRATLSVLQTAIDTGGSGAVASVFGRTGTVAAASGDYPASKITNDSSVPGSTVKAALETIAAASAADTRGFIFVNDYMTAAMVAAVIADGATHPMSDFYVNLAAAQVDFPLCTSNSNEACLEVIKAAVQAAYDQKKVESAETFSGGTLMFYGDYRCNAPIELYLTNVRLVGLGPYGDRARLRGSSAAGTIDAPTSIVDFGMYDEFGNDFANRGTNSVQDPRLVVEHMEFFGVNGANSSTVQSSGHNYIIGLRVRQASFVQVSDCMLHGRLYDGIVFTAPQLFTVIRRNFFGNIARDGVANWRGTPGNNSTTQWIYNNEFIGPYRYAILLDYGGGAVQAKAIIRDNSFENANSTSFYYTHPEWNVQGVVCHGVCCIKVGNVFFDGNRFEGWDGVPNAYGEVHLVDCDSPRVSENNINIGMFVSSLRADANSTTAFGVYYNGADAHNYCDITDQRNYNINSTAHPGINTEGIVLDHNFGGAVYYPDNIGGAATVANKVRDQSIMVLGVPTKAGTYADVVTPRESAVPTLMTGLGSTVYDNAFSRDAGGGRYFTANGPGGGTYRWINFTAQRWTAATAYNPFVAPHLYAFVRPTDANENGYFYQATAVSSDAKSHATTEPTWPTTIGSTVVDNHVTWTCVGREPLAAEVGRAEQLNISGKRVISASAAPTAGIWAVGDKVINTAPAAAGNEGWLCTTAGVAGVSAVFKSFGAIAA